MASTNAANSPPSNKRPRAKQACEPCRLRKRRCDSSMPCNMCSAFQYRCYYEKHPRKRSKIVDASTTHDLSTNPDDFIGHELPREERGSVEDASKLKSMEANSSMAFTKLLGRTLEGSNSAGESAKMFWFGWNLGAGSGARQYDESVTSIIGMEAMVLLTSLYFEHVHPLYGFLDKDFIFEQIDLRYEHPEVCKIPDHLLAGLAAAGALFAEGMYQDIVPALVEFSRKALEAVSLINPPTIYEAQSWLVRSLYLRATEHPHAVNMASSILMHIVEALGLHQEYSSAVPNVAEADQVHDAEIRRRTFWVARLLNTWVSFEYGRTRVHLRAITTELPKPKEGDFTTDYIHLYSLSCCLDPERDEGKWEDFIQQMDAFVTPHDAIELSRANLTMCGYRRLRLANPTLSRETIDRIVKIGLGGLEAARRMVQKRRPWWHVANVPFQVVCVFLAMDCRESLAHVATAIQVLEEVANEFQTVQMKDALKMARFLVRLAKKRKDEDSAALALSLKKEKPDPPPPPVLDLKPEPDAMPPSNGRSMGATGLPVTGTPSALTGASSEDWNMDLMNNLDFDWNFFLTADMPTFDGFAPDGMM